MRAQLLQIHQQDAGIEIFERLVDAQRRQSLKGLMLI